MQCSRVFIQLSMCQSSSYGESKSSKWIIVFKLDSSDIQCFISIPPPAVTEQSQQNVSQRKRKAGLWEVISRWVGKPQVKHSQRDYCLLLQSFHPSILSPSLLEEFPNRQADSCFSSLCPRCALRSYLLLGGWEMAIVGVQCCSLKHFKQRNSNTEKRKGGLTNKQYPPRLKPRLSASSPCSSCVCAERV